MDIHTIVINSNPPRFSETWMRRMTEMLQPNVEAAYFQGGLSAGAQSGGCRSHALLPRWMDRLPRRVALALGRRTFNHRLVQLLSNTSPNSRLLIHYLNHAVYLEHALTQCDIPTAVHCHGQDINWNLRIESLPFLRAHSRDYVSRVRRLADRITLIANSKATIEKLLSIGLPEDRIQLKYIGVPVPESLPSRPPISDAGLAILYLGRLTDFKGPVETIRAFDLACKMGLKGRLQIAGTGPQHKACEKEVDKSQFADQINLLGPVNAMRAKELLAQSHLFTAHNQRSPRTGQEEALGVSILEAMAEGIPVVTGRNGGVGETVVDGQTGILFEPVNIEQHAMALLHFSTD